MKRILTSFLCICMLFTSVYALDYDDAQEVIDYVNNTGYYTEDYSIFELYLQKLIETYPEDYYLILDSIVSSHDNHAGFYPLDYYDSLYGTPESYVGLGIVFARGLEGLLVKDVYEDTFAKEAGIKIGDVVTHIDGKTTKSMTLSDAKEFLSGELLSSVTLDVIRGEENLSFELIREDIYYSSISYETLTDGIEYIKINSIEGIETFITFKEAWDKIEKNESDVIIDLRGNGGGNVSTAERIIDYMIDKKNLVFASYDMRGFDSDYKMLSSGNGYSPENVIFLVDESTASAAEIISGAVAGLDYASIVGANTYGKGTGQYHLEIGGGMLTLTVMKTELPEYGFYDGIGLSPDYEIRNYSLLTKETSFTSISSLTDYPTTESQIYALEQRLEYLNYIETADKILDEKTIDAINEIKVAYDLTDSSFNEIISKIDEIIDSCANIAYIVDSQLNYAIDLLK